MSSERHLSNAMAVRVLTDALTATPCRNGVALHMTAPNCQPASVTQQPSFTTYLSSTGADLNTNQHTIKYNINNI